MRSLERPEGSINTHPWVKRKNKGDIMLKAKR